MAARIVVDPVTRIEGHLRIEAEVKDGKIVDAYSAGTMVRGLEKILTGRDPRDAWAFAERACGVCTTVHALGLGPHGRGRPGHRRAAERRNDAQPDVLHPVHAGPRRSFLPSARPGLGGRGQRAEGRPGEDLGDGPQHFQLAQDVRPSISATCRRGWQSSWRAANSASLPTATGATRPTSCRRKPTCSASAHYIEALEWQKEIVKIHTIFGGKNPHPNYLVGGVPCSLNIDEANAINAERLAQVGKLLDEAQQFVEQVYIPDLLAVASYYKDWAAIGGGLTNYLAYGDLPTNGFGDPAKFKFPRGAILDRDLSKVHEVDGRDPTRCKSRSPTRGTSIPAATSRRSILGRARRS